MTAEMFALANLVEYRERFGVVEQTRGKRRTSEGEAGFKVDGSDVPMYDVP